MPCLSVSPLSVFLFLLCGVFSAGVGADGRELLYAFTVTNSEDDDLTGFRDAAGQVVIPPKFTAYLTPAKRFDAIIAVHEPGADGAFGRSYYLTRTGREVGKGEMHVFDNAFDCESEGFIRFRRRDTDKVGLFDRSGDIAIPADYDEMSRVTNGMVAALQDSRKIIHGEHYSRSGGKSMLLDTQNRVLVTPFVERLLYELDFTDLTISDTPDPAPERVNLQGVDGRYYAFAHLEKSFRRWLETALPENFDHAALSSVLFEHVVFSDRTEGSSSIMDKASFADRYLALIRDRLAVLRHPDADYFIVQNSISSFSDLPGSEKYRDNCGDLSTRHPVMALIINYPNEPLRQDHFYFLRTEQGYRLIEAAL
ncbi:MAG: WG repeat-containing protein [Zoogloeaceae bacterium]|jgi:hypothetical protein|nr:WG repeat-containing protein [Zoogloeaceae bacterium]